MKGAGLHSEGCSKDIQVQTSTLIDATLSWLHLYGCKLAFGVQYCALKGAGIVKFLGCKLLPLLIFLVCTGDNYLLSSGSPLCFLMLPTWVVTRDIVQSRLAHSLITWSLASSISLALPTPGDAVRPRIYAKRVNVKGIVQQCFHFKNLSCMTSLHDLSVFHWRKSRGDGGYVYPPLFWVGGWPVQIYPHFLKIR